MDIVKIFGPVIERAMAEFRPAIEKAIALVESIDKRLDRIEQHLGLTPLEESHDGNDSNDNGSGTGTKPGP